MTDKKKYLLIVNPHARGGRSLSDLATIESMLDEKNIEYKSRITHYPGHASEILQQENTHFDIIIAIGGDGTINEIINGLKDPKPLGIIPLGSGNDFARSCHIPLNSLEKSLDIILKNQTKQVDLGVINDQYFINGIGIGFDGHANQIAQRMKGLKGGLKYFAAIIIGFFTYKPLKVKITSQPMTYQGPLFMLSVSNGRFIGNGLQLSANARLDDHQLDYFAIKDISRWQILTQFRHLTSGNGHKIPQAEQGLLDSIQITSRQPIPLHYDGESFSTPTYKINIKLADQTQEVIGHWDLH